MPTAKAPQKTPAIRTATDRSALPVSRTVVWERISTGRRLGYRKQGDVWIAASRNEDGSYTNATLGKFDTYADALAAANKWFAARHGVEVSGRVTVEQACAAYLESRRIEGRPGAATDAEARFRRLVNGTAFGQRHLDTLTARDCRLFRDGMVKLTGINDKDRAAKSSANRNWAGVRAALNWSFKQGMVTSKPWEAVTPFSETHGRREGYLTVEQRRALLDALPADVSRFVQAMFLTACRPGELFAANVADFDRVQGTLAIRKSKTKARVCTLSTAACEFFREITRDRIGNAPLLSRDTPAVRKKGNVVDYRFDKAYLKYRMRAANKVAGLPADTVAYCARHTAISEMMLAGMDSTVVALLAGTSTDMIERHYGHMRGDKLRAALDRVAVL